MIYMVHMAQITIMIILSYPILSCPVQIYNLYTIVILIF